MSFANFNICGGIICHRIALWIHYHRCMFSVTHFYTAYNTILFKHCLYVILEKAHPYNRLFSEIITYEKELFILLCFSAWNNSFFYLWLVSRGAGTARLWENHRSFNSVIHSPFLAVVFTKFGVKQRYMSWLHLRTHWDWTTCSVIKYTVIKTQQIFSVVSC